MSTDTITHLCPAPVETPAGPQPCLAPIPCEPHEVTSWQYGLAAFGHTYTRVPGAPLPPPAHAACPRHPFPRIPGIVRRLRRCHPTCTLRKDTR